MGIPKLELFPLFLFLISNLYPKLENFTTQNSAENLMSSVSERKQKTTSRYCNELIIYYIGVKPTIFQVLYGSYPYILAIGASK